MINNDRYIRYNYVDKSLLGTVENNDSAGKWDHVITRIRALLTEVIDIIQVKELAKSSNCL